MSVVLKSYILSVVLVGGLVLTGILLLQDEAVYTAYGAASTSSVSVGKAAPTVSAVTVTPNPIVLTENVTTTVTIVATVQDANGCSDVFPATGTITAVLYRGTVAASSSCTYNELNCYPGIAMANTGSELCTGGVDTSGVASATVPVWFFADPTDASSTSYSADTWYAYVKAVDSQGASSTATSTGNELNSLVAMRVTATTAFNNGTTISAGVNTGTNNATTTLTNTGNSVNNTAFSGTDMTSGGNTIAATNEKYATSSVAFGLLSWTLSNSAATQQIRAPRATVSTTAATTSTYWGLVAPTGTASGTYTGTNTFTAIWYQ